MFRIETNLAALALAVLSSACAAPVGGDEDIGATREAITNGADDDDDPAVVGLLVQGELECTGVLVAKTLVVTAAHCVSPSPPDAVYFGTHPGAQSGGTTIEIAAATAHPDFDEDSLENDIAVVELASKAPATPIAISVRPLDASSKSMGVRIVGFGATGEGETSSLRKRTGATAIDSFTDETFKYHASPSQTCSGDSGGPAFASIDGEEVVVGITSSGDSDCKSHATDTRMDAYADFVQGYAKKYSAAARSAVIPSAGCSSSPARPSHLPAPLLALLALVLGMSSRRSGRVV